MSQETQQLGEMFRKKRKEMHLSLKEVENSTSIRAGYIQAIEKGTINEFISKVYVLGFIKQYAGFLEMDVAQIIKEYPNVFKMLHKPREFPYGIGTLEMRKSLGGGIKWLPNLLWALGAAAIIILAYTIAKAIGFL